MASVGEDIEAKVDYLTQDKARLAADIRNYSSKISKDFEEKEVLSVASDLWKSKFLACRFEQAPYRQIELRYILSFGVTQNYSIAKY